MRRRKLRLDVKDNQYSVTSLSRIHCRSAVPRTPKSPLPVRYSAACCLTQFSSARGVQGPRWERRGRVGRNFSHKCATPTRRHEIGIRPCNIDYFLCYQPFYARTSHFLVLSTVTYIVLSNFKVSLFTLKSKCYLTQYIIKYVC